MEVRFPDEVRHASHLGARRHMEMNKSSDTYHPCPPGLGRQSESSGSLQRQPSGWKEVRAPSLKTTCFLLAAGPEQKPNTRSAVTPEP